MKNIIEKLNKNARTTVGTWLDPAHEKESEKITDKPGTVHRAPTGITLIALILTIIVLLILAGVALNFVMGENGILRHAEFATEKYENKAQIEQNELAQINDYIQNSRETVTIDKNEYEQMKQDIAALKTKTYDLNSVLNLDSTVDHLNLDCSYIKKAGNVVDIQLCVYFKSNVTANTFQNVATITASELIPQKGIWNYSEQGVNIGNSIVGVDGIIQLRSTASTYAYYIRATYIVD